jgi:CheY-like chemotaxis protein
MNGDLAQEQGPATVGDDTTTPSNDNIANDDAQKSAPEAPAVGTVEAVGPAANSGKESGSKSVLLVDSNLRSRESRAKAMRDKGVRVDSVASADAARVRLAAEKYSLVLVDPGRDVEGAEALVKGIRANNSRQLVGFLVGSPLFVAKSLSGSNSRPRRAQEPSLVVSAEKPSTPAAFGVDFGQRIRDAEAEEEIV